MQLKISIWLIWKTRSFAFGKSASSFTRISDKVNILPLKKPNQDIVPYWEVQKLLFWLAEKFVAKFDQTTIIPLKTLYRRGNCSLCPKTQIKPA